MNHRKRGIIIAKVKPGSIAERLGLRPGDRLLTVSGIIPRDVIDYRYLISGENVKLKVLQRDGKYRQIFITKDYDADLGLGFPADCFDGIRFCQNKCVFCFVDQLPAGLRLSLYEKDDDYRLSFLHGNFITLTNLSPADFCRILTFHLSPLYISVHATVPQVRSKMLGRREPVHIMEKLTTLAEGGIFMHIQIVLCPGINNGFILDQTIQDLAKLWPQVSSVGVVPVGLTKYRKNFLRPFARLECLNLIKQIASYQKLFRQKFGSSFVYLADEFYLQAGFPFPPRSFYDKFSQLENGIGLARFFYDEFHSLLPSFPSHLGRPRHFVVGTGYLGARVLAPVIARLNLIRNLELKLLPVPNTFFGPHISVTGLLTGRDLIWGLRGVGDREVLLPRVLVCRGSSLLLDGLTVEEVSCKLKVKIRVIEPGARSLLEAVTT